MFHDATCAVLQHLTSQPPLTEDAWYGPWTTILTTLFPITQGYLIRPQRHLPDDQSIVMLILKLSDDFLHSRTVLVVKFKNTDSWHAAGISHLYEQIDSQTDAAFAADADGTVYWIGVIGPHWQYGIKYDDGWQPPRQLINWHDTTHDPASYNDFQCLTTLVANM